MAKRAIAVTRVIQTTTSVRYETVGVLISDIERVTPANGIGRSIIRFKRPGTSDIVTPHAVFDLVGAINGDINLCLKEDE